ncbi:MAG: carbamoyltransferase HypF [Acidobacteriaceae bacterium]
MRQRKHIQVRGIVQGVGFRPFVYKLANSLGLSGYVFNSSSGVTIEVEGEDLEIFLQTLAEDPPALAEITGISISEVAVEGGSGFSILHSREEMGEFALVSPDAGTCDACWHDFGDPCNRRYGYPFTNCTHCGPRYTILRDIPYDRATTTMARFVMCGDCQKEYDDPNDRRFHAQPNACAVCGPSLALVKREAEISFERGNSLAILRRTRALLGEGKIVAVKGLGGFLLACDATNPSAVAELRRRKRRLHKPFALMARDLATARLLCEVSSADEVSLLHPRRPIVIMARREGTTLAPEIAPGDRTLGVMLPYTPLHYLLFSDSPEMESAWVALVMTSGNLSEEPIVTSNEDAVNRLGGVADWFLLHNRDIATRVDDSVVRTFEGKERVLRRSRGFVPQAIDMGCEMEEVLAFGGELKNTFCLTKGRYAVLSQHIGDLENYETMQFFEETLNNLGHIFKVTPSAVAYDLHPSYLSTRMAMKSGIERKIGVQHHHAHIASCMAENRLRGRVLGVALDGTGFGSDGRIWGFEFLAADFAGFKRRAHLRNVLLPGGDAAVRQPWRMALSYVRDSCGPQFLSGLTCFETVSEKQLALVGKMLAEQIQTVQTSSCGRLFDAVAALLGLAPEVTFEGQAAIALEALADACIDDRYDFAIEDGETAILDMRPAIVTIVKELGRGRPRGEISACFHNTLSAAIGELCARIGTSDGLNRVCLSGGSFQNLYLLDHTVVELRRRGFEVFLHTQVPANDGGLSLGQAVIANQRLHEGG